MSGSEKEIKALKERFLRAKTPPALSNIDIHVICGCIKDFLRSLREPLIPTSLWRNFSNAVQTVDEATAVRELFAAINQLPQANRDTLAFLVMHLQRYEYDIYTKIFLDFTKIIFFCVYTALPISKLSKCRLKIWLKFSVQLYWDIRQPNQINMPFSLRQ